MTSPGFSFKGTGKSILISLSLALMTAAATWLASITELFDFGEYAPIVGALAVFGANAIRKYVQSKK